MCTSHPHARLQVLERKDENTDQALPILKIGSGNIAFLLKILSEQCDFRTSSDGKQWWLSFFDKSPFRRQVLVELCCRNFGQRTDDIVTAHWLDNNENPAIHPQLLPQASQLSRGSSTLALDQLKPLTSKRALVADRRQLVYLSGSHAQFLRVILCQALALAYTDVLNTCMDDMVKLLGEQTDTDMVKPPEEHANTEQVLMLYENILRFDAMAYFRLPVVLARHELSEAWKIIASHYQLNVLHSELTQQVSAVAKLLSAKREAVQLQQQKAREQAEKTRERQEQAARARMAQADRRRTLWLTGIGLLLTAASLGTLLQTTPQQWKANLSAWGTHLSAWGILPDTSSQDENKAATTSPEAGLPAPQDIDKSRP